MPDPEVFVDLYEVLQISPSADLETIQRVYRLLALRYHPDNKETGNPSEFELVLKAYRVLSDLETRASYDSEYYQRRKLRWKIFDQGGALTARETEKRQREGVLSLLYAKRLQEIQKPGMNLREMENLLDCAREYLEFSLWYLREKGLIQVGDNGRYSITALGVDTCNENDNGDSPPRRDRLLIAAREPVNDNAASSAAASPQPKAPSSKRRQPPSPDPDASHRAIPSKIAPPEAGYPEPARLKP